MRNFSNGVVSSLSKKQGIEPVLFVGVNWDGAEYYYSSQVFPGARKQIVSIGGLETTQVVQGNGTSQSVSVILSDTDGHIKQMLDTVDIHKRPAKVYLGFPNLPLSQAVVLIDGEVNSEMVWDERARTFSFAILNKIEGRLFGFAMEDGLFGRVNEQDRAKPWPFRFGETCAYQTVKVRNGVSGLLREGQGVLDPTLDAKICQARKIDCPKVKSELVDPVPASAQVAGLDQVTIARQQYEASIQEDGSVENEFGEFGIPRAVAGVAPEYVEDQEVIQQKECQRAKFETLCQLLRDRANQLEFVNPTMEILGGENFPQGRETRIRVDDVIYTGVFSGETFTINQTNRQDAPTQSVDCQNVGPLAKGWRDRGDPEPSSLEQCETPSAGIERRIVGGAVDAWSALGNMEDSEFTWLPSGSRVFLEESAQEVNIVSLTPGLVIGVFAYRTFGDTRQLTVVPTSYYEVVNTDYGDLNAVEIHLNRNLSSYRDEGWGDDLYVHFVSDIGPNPADVIEWIVNNFTDFTVDSASFSSARTSLTNYPCNYYHAAKQGVLGVLNNLAYEARCALTITDNVVKIKYLPKEPVADKVLTESDLVAGSFSFSHTRTEDLVTSSDIAWQPAGADILSTNSVERKLTVERNINKYGYFGSQRKYVSINNETQALKTATFWSIRDSNTWRLVKFQTTLEHMDLELFDTVQLNISEFPDIKCVVEKMNVNPENGIVEFECWTPILSGTTEEYLFAWPAEKPQEPYPGDAFEVESPILNITPPEGHPLYVSSTSGQPVVSPTTGDRIPSDLDDVFPVTLCSDMNSPELIDTIEPQFKRIDFLAADPVEEAERAAAIASGNLSVNFVEDEENIVCGRPSLETCVWTVNVLYGTATSIAPSPQPGGGFDCPIVAGPCSGEGTGKRCAGDNFNWCRTFGSEGMATAFALAIKARIEMEHCTFVVGKTAPVSVTGPIPIKGKNCPEIDAQLGSGPT